MTTPLSATSHSRAVSPQELSLGGPATAQAESRKAHTSPPNGGVLSPGLRDLASSAAWQIVNASPKEAITIGQTCLDDWSSAIMGSHVGDSDSTSGDEPSSPSMHKTNRRLKMPGAGTHVSKHSKARTTLRPMVSAIDDTEAKSTFRRKERPEDTIRESYKKRGLEASRLIITHEPHTMHPLALYMGSTAKNQSELTNGRWKKLCGSRDDLLGYIPTAGDAGADRKNIDLVRKLSLSSTDDQDAPRLVDVVKALRRQSDVAADELNLFRCLEGLAVLVTKHHDEAEIANVRSIAKRWKIGANMTSSASTFISLNYVLLHLVEDWRGLHMLVLVFL
ncbi:hypothetical protein LTR12_018410, partial [Friedmanniomyces endolithicus]